MAQNQVRISGMPLTSVSIHGGFTYQRKRALGAHNDDNNNNGNNFKKSKQTQNVVINKELKFELLLSGQ